MSSRATGLTVNLFFMSRIGDKVRVKNESNIFSKGDILKFNKTIYTVDSVDGQKIYVKNEEGTVLSKFFKPYQLVKVDSVEKYEKPNESHEEEHKGDSKGEEASEGVEGCGNRPEQCG